VTCHQPRAAWLSVMLGLAVGTGLDQWQANGGTNQDWTFVPAG
jgi:hypothetical protein